MDCSENDSFSFEGRAFKMARQLFISYYRGVANQNIPFEDGEITFAKILDIPTK